jgi:hypothetical protein
MSKIFTDNAKWERPWFRKLTPEKKLIFLYLLDKCDRAGYWEIDLERLQFETGLSDLPSDWTAGIKDVSISSDGKWCWLRDYVLYQQGTAELNPSNNAHLGIIQRVNKMSPLFLTKKQPLTRGSGGAHEPPCNVMYSNVKYSNVNVKDKEQVKAEAGELAQHMIARISETQGSRLLTTVATTSTGIAKMLRRGVDPDQVRRTIDWLVTDNLKRDKRFVVLSGESLYEKWDRLQAAMKSAQADSDPEKRAWMRTVTDVSNYVREMLALREDRADVCRLARDKWGGAPLMNGRDPVTAGIERGLNEPAKSRSDTTNSSGEDRKCVKG